MASELRGAGRESVDPAAVAARVSCDTSLPLVVPADYFCELVLATCRRLSLSREPVPIADVEPQYDACARSVVCDAGRPMP